MNNPTLKHTAFYLLAAFLSAAFCSAQVKSNSTVKITVKPLSFTSKNPKLTKTQGSNESQNVHCSLQDKAGNLWFGTTGEGVYQYDGKVFTQFTVKDGLSDNTIWCMLEDKSGVLWLGTDNGISRFDGETFSKIPLISAKNAVNSICQLKDGTLLFGSTEDLYCYDGKSFSRFLDKYFIRNDQNLQLKSIQCILQDSSGTVWMGSGPMPMEGVIRFDGTAVTASKPNGDGWIRYLFQDKNKNIWFGGRSNGVFLYNGISFTNFTQKQGIGNPILIDKSGNIWFDGGEKLGTVENETGIWRYDGKAFKNFTVKDGFSKYAIWTMLEDHNGNLWIGTRNCGLYRYNGKTVSSFSE